MIIISTINYPTESTQEMAKRFLEAPALPDYMVRRGPFVAARKESGIQTVTFYELDNAKLADAIQDIGNYLAIFFGVPGFKYEIVPYLEISEALKTIGM